ncbi:MAG: ABC transporter substrate-binding protein [Rhodospirillales bacterium]|nr:ABC transporter substrate-binding protein [Rhodospirillales bacterium]
MLGFIIRSRSVAGTGGSVGESSIISLLSVFLLGVLLFSGSSRAQSPILLGLDADMSSASAEAGEAIRRGTLLAINEINASGGLLGRPLELVVRDHRGNPARGLDNIQEFSDMPDILAVIGGLHTPVALQELQLIHDSKIIYLGAWAAGTPIVENGFDPNYVFRVSVRDEFAGGFMVENAIKRGSTRLGMLLERTGWGRSNEKAINSALEERGITTAAVEWFNWGITDMSEHIERLHAVGADTIILVSNPPEGLVAVRSMAARPEGKRLPIISHWGITGGTFSHMAGNLLGQVDLMFLQTFSFLAPPVPERANRLFQQYRKMFPDAKTADEVLAPAGIAHAYDLVKILAMAVRQAGTLDRAAVRDAMERIEQHKGLMRDYTPPFTARRHDALNADDFIMARYGENGVIIPEQPYD